MTIDWTIVGSIAGVIGVVIAIVTWRWPRKQSTPPPATKTKVTISGSPGAKGAGRDMGAAGGVDDAPHETEIEISNSPDATAAGRDDRG